MFDPAVLKRGIDGIREKPERYRVLTAFRFDTFFSLYDSLGEQVEPDLSRWQPLLEEMKRLIDNYRKESAEDGDARVYLTPTTRFLIGVLLCLHDKPFDLVGPMPDGKITDESSLLPKQSFDSFRSRRSIIADRLDPLAKTARQLDIRRYITTNYDFEIERFFQDMGYRKFPPHPDATRSRPLQPGAEDYRTDGIGGLLKDQTFQREKASNLVSFLIEDERLEASVFHLHGRATLEDQLVIAEQNYADLYLWEDRYRETVNEGILMAFSGTPLLFLGLGMTEADLLRPLRQFMSNRDRTIGYHAIALLPAEKPIEARTKLSASLYLRYGVHTVFYGGGQLPIELANGETETLPLDWLCRIMQVIGGLKAAVGALEAGKNTDLNGDLIDRLAREMGHIGSDISGYPDAKTLAFYALFGVAVQDPDHAADRPAAKARMREYASQILDGELKIQTCTFTPSRRSAISATTRHNDESVFVDGGENLNFYTAMLSRTLHLVCGLPQAVRCLRPRLANRAPLDRPGADRPCTRERPAWPR